MEAIKILNTVALTDAVEDISATPDGKLDDATGVYVYYDVVDQYGESMKNSTTIDWSTSCKVKKNDKTNGVLTLIRTDNKAFTYGESIYVTGVHAKTGKSVSATLTVGAKQALNTVEVKGFVKKGTSEILSSLPAGFKSQAYYLVYSVLDQNGNKMAAKKYMGSEAGTEAEVTFISDNILVLKEITKTDETILTLDGEEYCAAFLVPGIDVNKGGEVNITAIANKTGNKSLFNVAVGNNQILKSFTMSQPSGVVADGEWVEIPFVALDQNGEEIKNFVTLASQSDFNRLQLNASYGFFALSENDDGTACLSWCDDSGVGKDGRWNSNSEDGIDRPISLTAVVIGGETCNEMLYVQDKAMPVAIKSADVNSVYVQDSTAKITLSSFTFVDQYGRTLDDTFGTSGRDDNTGNANKGWIYDNGFFAYVNGATGLSGTVFNDQKFGVAVEFKGSKDNLKQTAVPAYATITGPSIKHISTDDDATHYVTGAAFTITDAYDFNVCADQTLKFSIEKIKDGDAAVDNNYSNVSPIKNHTFKGVNIDRVSGFEIKDLNTFYVNTPLSGKANGAVGGVTAGSITGTTDISGAKIGTGASDDVATDDASVDPYYQKVNVTGKFNGVTVDVPQKYFTVAGGKLGTALDGDVVSKEAIGANVIDSVAVSTSALKTSDLYDANSAQFTRKLAEDTLKVTVYKATSGSGVIVTDTAIVNTATKKVAISDAAPYAATICAADAYTVQPCLTTISNTRLVSPSAFNGVTGLLKSDDSKAYKKAYSENSYWKVLDQYGVEIAQTNVASGDLKYAYKITDVKENADRYADNNFAVDKNDTPDASIKGAECGDTFVLTISASYGGATATKEIKMTIGGDYYAVINTSQNAYTEVLVDKDGTTGLEYQRTEALGKN